MKFQTKQLDFAKDYLVPIPVELHRVESIY